MHWVPPAAILRTRRARMRDQDVISDEVLHRPEHELDVEALRMGVGEMRTGAKGGQQQNSGSR